MIKVILPARKIPEGSTVTKLTGTVKYEVHDSVVIYGTDGEKVEIKADEGCRYLCHPGRVEINAIQEDKELIWEVDEWRLASIIEENLLTDPGE